ncbi:MAG: hypothetical protein ABIZ81_02420 [Opitutaceae bacterium]
MNPALKLTVRNFPACIADLGFTAQLPTDWIAHELPPEEMDFSVPTKLVPLAIVAAPHATIAFAFAARPAYDDGTLHDWASFHLNHNQLNPRAIGSDQVAGVPAVIGEATQESDVGTILVRFAFLEDGGRLINLSLTAPEQLADAVRDAWFAMLQSFTLESPKGSRFTIAPVSTAPQAEPMPPSDSTPPSDSPPPSDSTPTALMTSAEVAAAALATDASSLDPENPINARLRENGVGLVPRVASIDLAEKSARVGAGAVQGFFRVPLGWHVIDDGKRTLVFDAANRIQVSLSQRLHEGASATDFARQLVQPYLEQQPDLPTIEATLSGIACAGVRGVTVGPETLDQLFFVRDIGREGLYLVARISATADDSKRALDLAGDIVATFDAPASGT